MILKYELTIDVHVPSEDTGYSISIVKEQIQLTWSLYIDPSFRQCPNWIIASVFVLL